MARAAAKIRTIWRWANRYLALTDLLDLALAIVAIALGAIAFDKFTGWAVALTTIYVVVVLVRFCAVVKDRVAKDHLEAEIFCGLFDLLNTHLFVSSNRTRFTLFKVDPKNKKTIVPWYRYEKAGTGPISDVEPSKVRYERGEGLTGRSWKNAGRSKLVYADIPPFANRADFEHYYSQELGVKPETAKLISDYMMSVRTFLSIGYADTRGRFLGVLSVDMQFEITRDPKGKTLVFKDDDGFERRIDGQHIRLLSETVRSVLRSISCANGGLR